MENYKKGGVCRFQTPLLLHNAPAKVYQSNGPDVLSFRLVTTQLNLHLASKLNNTESEGRFGESNVELWRLLIT